MKRVLAIVLCVMMVGSLFAMAISANAAEEDPDANQDAIATTVGDDTVTDPTNVGDIDVPETDDVPDEDATVVETTAEETTTDETTVETTAETTISTESTEPTTVTETTGETEPASKDQPVAPAKKPSPKTGENMWLWIGIGIFGVALIAIIITFVVKKKAK